MSYRSSIAKVVEAASAVTGKRYCFSHQGEVPVAEGSFVMRGKYKRWICLKCQEKSKRRNWEISHKL